ncbi:Uncharacterised protein g8535 [Pycnogonum litorale]
MPSNTIRRKWRRTAESLLGKVHPHLHGHRKICVDVWLPLMQDRMGFNEAARQYKIPKPTIRRHRLGLNKYAKSAIKLRGGPCVLPKEVEDELVRHIKDLDDLFFGITVKDLRKLAYEVARAHGIDKFSEEKQSANKTWYYNFMRRHPDLRLRTPEATSMARTKGFNRKDIGDFFEKYYALIDEHEFKYTTWMKQAILLFKPLRE